jgi:uncharacterized phiE125 gp8 family phage protein
MREATLLTAATWEPVSLREIKTQVQLAPEYTAHDVELQQLVTGAREQYERDTSQVLASSSWQIRFDDWPVEYFEIDARPITAIERIRYYDTTGTLQTVASSVYELDAAYPVARIRLGDNQQWPTARGHEGDILIDYTAGYASQAAVPASIKHAVMLLAATWFEQRTAVGSAMQELPLSYTAMVHSRMRASYP